jgi:hypothetical protein
MTFRKHFTKCCNIFGTNISVINLFFFFQHFSEMFQTFLRNVGFVNILQNVATFFRYVEQHFSSFVSFFQHFSEMLQHF